LKITSYSIGRSLHISRDFYYKVIEVMIYLIHIPVTGYGQTKGKNIS